jgi:hypothetical protein
MYIPYIKYITCRYYRHTKARNMSTLLIFDLGKVKSIVGFKLITESKVGVNLGQFLLPESPEASLSALMSQLCTLPLLELCARRPLSSGACDSASWHVMGGVAWEISSLNFQL